VELVLLPDPAHVVRLEDEVRRAVERRDGSLLAVAQWLAAETVRGLD